MQNLTRAFSKNSANKRRYFDSSVFSAVAKVLQPLDTLM
jgi:hypothetical protein